MAELPRYASVSGNNGISYKYPPFSATFKELTKNLPDGDYIAIFEYKHYRGGWASGSNWYGEGFYEEA